MIWKRPPARRQGFRICCCEPLEIRLNLSSRVPVIQGNVEVLEEDETAEFEAVEIQLEQAYESGQVMQFQSNQIELLTKVMEHVADDLSVSVGELRQLVVLPTPDNAPRLPVVVPESLSDFLKTGDQAGPTRLDDRGTEIALNETQQPAESTAESAATLVSGIPLTPEAPPMPQQGAPAENLSAGAVENVEQAIITEVVSHADLVNPACLPESELGIRYGGAPDLLGQEIQLSRQVPGAPHTAEPDSSTAIDGVSHAGHSLLTVIVVAGGLLTMSTASRPFGVVGIARRIRRRVDCW